MIKYSVKELTALSGVSIRTLHYYDSIGLLKPASRSEAGYRYYSEKELLQLQQILFYKELGFSLKEIISMLQDPEFDLITALNQHQEALKKQKKRINGLLRTIDRTIIHIKNGEKMTNPKMLYDGLPKEFGTSYRKEAKEKYGKERIEKSEKSLMKMGKKDFTILIQNQKDINSQLFALRKEEPEDEAVQKLIAQHYVLIRKFWGTHGTKDNQKEAYKGLGALFVSDERYTKVDGESQPEFAKFLKDAMHYYADLKLK